jgi:HK97 gp10 family phage protein
MPFELNGDVEFIKSMQKIAVKLESKKDKTRILKAGAEPIRKAMSQKAPRSMIAKEHMGDNIIISDMQEGDFVEVGPAKKFFYAKFQEFGTVKQNAKPFAEPAYLEKRQEAIEAMANETKKVIEGG